MRTFLLFISISSIAYTTGFSEGLNVETPETSQMSLDDQREFKGVAGMLRCPSCTGLSVLDSDAKFSLQIQSVVKDQIAQGKTKEEILSYFEKRYGPWILREPPKKGVNIVAWVFPLVLIILGPILVWFLVWRRSRTVAENTVRSTEEISKEFEQAVARALAAQKER